MKDPLQAEETPYEILGVARGADSVAIHKAFNVALTRGSQQRALIAKQALQRPEERALIDLFQYDPDSLRRLSPSPLEDDSVLKPPRRAATASAWEQQLQASFPNFPAAHSLAVLWYWSALHDEAEGAPVSEVAEAWEGAIACWSMLVAGKALADVAEPVVGRLRGKLDEAAQERRARGDRDGARRYGELELQLSTEVETAKALAAAGLRVADGEVSCGPLMLRRSGFLDAVTRELDAALERNPDSARLRSLRERLSPNASIAALVERGRPQEAVEALDALAPEQRDSPEASRLRARALLALGQRQASVGQLEDALASWEAALLRAPGEEVASISSAIVAACRERAARLSRSNRDEAIVVLELGLELTGDDKLQESLAEFLTSRGIEAFHAAQKEAEKADDLRSLVPAFESGLRDLERAENLGSSRAREQAEAARELLEQAKTGMIGVPSKVAGPLVKAREAAEREDWDEAVTQSRAALAAAGPDEREALEKNLAVCLVNRAMANGEKSMKALSPDENTAKTQMAVRAMKFLSTPAWQMPASGAVAVDAPAAKSRPWWRPKFPKPKLTPGGVLAVVYLLSPVWFPALLLGLGAGAKAAGNAFWVLAFIVWIFGNFVLGVLGWIADAWRKATRPFALSGGTSRSSYDYGSFSGHTCDINGCDTSAQFEVDVGRLLGASSGGPAQHLCAKHASMLEATMSQPLSAANPQAVAGLNSAKSDLEEAAKLDPEAGAIRENLGQIDEVLKTLRKQGVDTSVTAQPLRLATQPRKTATKPAKRPRQPAKKKATQPAKRAAQPPKAATKTAKRSVRPKSKENAPSIYAVDGACPRSHPIKVELGAEVYHAPGGREYKEITPEFCFRNKAAAEAAGLVPADRQRGS